MKNFRDFLTHELKDIYSAENQIIKWLPKLAKAAQAEELKNAFLHHLEETKHQIERLEKIAAELDVDLKGRVCHAMKALFEEAEEVMEASYPHEVKDAALISCAQRVEHYEIAVYGTLKAFARHLGFREIEGLLDETSKEEGQADKKLSELALGTSKSKGINEKAISRSA